MFPGLNPKKMQAMMKQMGIAQEEIDANRVIIECDDRKIIIDEPSVVKVNMQGQENFQISGDVSESEADGSLDIDEASEVVEEEEEDKGDEDIRTIMEQTGVSEDEARKALDKAEGDLTDAMISLG